ncbi:MAG: hypothetical protein IPF99_34795 [Deltaproteobacteria bacterium]|nr:hypothetical protein [Deltaproteobacteria bacterium]
MNRRTILALLWTGLSAAACGDATTPLESTDVPVVDTASPVDVPAVDVPAVDARTNDAPAAVDATAPRDAAIDRRWRSQTPDPDAPRPPADAGGLRDVAVDRAVVVMDAPRPADVVAVDAPTDRGPMDAGAADVPALDGAPFSDAGAVMPSRTRVGPQTGARIVFNSSVQRGSFWELPNGDVLTSFQTSRTQPRPGVAIYDLHYKMRRIVGATVAPMPDTADGTCRDDGRLNGCDVGPDPDGPSERALVAADGSILIVQRRAMSDGRGYPALMRLDPATGTLSPVAEYADLRSARADTAYTPPMALRALGSGQIALAAEMIGVPAQTLVVLPDGRVAARAQGYAFGDRWSPFGLLLGEAAGYPLNRFRWWDARTGSSAFLYALPGAEPGMSPPSFRTFVSPSGDVLLPGNTYTDRLIHLGPAGRVVEDRAFTPSGFLGVYADGAYLTYERYAPGDVGYAARARNAAGEGTLLYDDATLIRDAGWSPAPRGGFRYPYMLGAKRAVIDDAGNAYIGFVLQTGGDSRTETYLAAFARDGRRLWGLRLPSTGFGECHARAVLSGRRLAVVCPGRYVNNFLIVGE